ncbi:hypothetical protein ACFLUU_04655 [Chloroflexota bacterium]
MYLKKIFTLFIIVLISLLLIPAFTSNQAGEELPPQEQVEEKGEELPPLEESKETDAPPIDYPKKGNPKLSSHLWDLIEAEKQGEAESLAQSWGRGEDMVDGKVLVEIEASPGQLDAAANLTAAVGTIHIVSSRMNLVEAVVPITSLEALANQESIRFIRLPVRPMQEGE